MYNEGIVSMCCVSFICIEVKNCYDNQWALVLHLLSNDFEPINICFRQFLLKITILGRSLTKSVIPSTILQNSSSQQQNFLISSNPPLLSTIFKTVRHLYTKIDNLIKLLDNQRNVIEISKKKANNQVYFSLASSNTSASPPSLTPQPRLL